MWLYEKKLEYPAKVSGPNPALAKNIITQYGGPDGELAASLRYLTQRYSMPTNQTKGLLTDIGTEESVPRGCRSAKGNLLRLTIIYSIFFLTFSDSINLS